MTKQEMQAEALRRARTGTSARNDAIVLAAFVERGILEVEIQPRVNVLSFNAWKAVGRHVKRGEKGVALPTVIERQNEDGETRRMLRRAYVFHVSQTETTS